MGNLYDNYIVPAELDEIISFSPITGQSLAKVSKSNPQQTAKKIDKAHKAFLKWQLIPAPRRGELVSTYIGNFTCTDSVTVFWISMFMFILFLKIKNKINDCDSS